MSNSDLSVLVVGGTGFIGRSVIRKLLAGGFQTTALALAGRGQADRLSSVAGLNVLAVPSASPADLGDGLAGRRFDYIVNLASAGVDPADRTAEALEDGNSVFLTRLLEAVSAHPPTLFIHAGSWSEYAPPIDQTPISEDHRLDHDAGYGGAKANAERDGSACAAGLGIAFVTLRLFHIYGPGEPEHRLTPYLLSTLASGQIAELSPGDQVRDFVFIDDAAEAFIAALNAGQRLAGGAYNVCSATPVSVRHVVETLADILGRPHDTLHFGALPPRPDEAAWVVGDNGNFEKATGWRPGHNLEQGLKKTVTAARAGDNGHG